MLEAPYLDRVYLRSEVSVDPAAYPFSLGFVEDLDLRLERDVTFFVGENGSGKSTVLEARSEDPDVLGDPFGRYGGRSLHERSHGEAFLQMFTSWMNPGIILMDEPESALSPQRQLGLLAQMAHLAQRGRTQFIVATHSPIILTFPSAQILSFDDGLRPVALEETSHYQITKTLLENPAIYWRHLSAVDDDPSA